MWDSRKYVEEHLKGVRERDFRRTLYSLDVETEGLYGPLTLLVTGDKEGESAWYDYPEGLIRPEDMVVWHGGQYDMRIAQREGWKLPYAMYLDSHPLSWLVDENEKVGLKPTVQRHVGKGKYSQAQYSRWLEGWKGNQESNLKEYALMDAYYTRQVVKKLWPIVEDQKLLLEWLQVESPMSLIVAEMEDRGIALDLDLLATRREQATDHVSKLKQYMMQIHDSPIWLCQRERCIGGVFHPKRGEPRECRECDGTGMNLKVWNSSQQLGELLFQELGVQPIDYTEAGNPKTGEEYLVKFREQEHLEEDSVAFIHRLMEYREWNKLLTSFYEPYYQLQSDVCRAHAKPWGTVTGRFAYENPNLQQVPPSVRSVFVPRPGHKFVDVDYVQLELYIMAALSHEEKILEVYEAHGDLHQRTADLAGISRGGGKTLNFSLMYGVSPSSVARRLNVTKERAKQIGEGVLGGYDTLFGFFDDTKEQARRDGFVKTLFGRKRRVHNIDSTDFRKRYHAENQAINAPIQGTAADIIKAALIRCKLEVPEALPLLQVHDEMLFEVPEQHAEEIKEAVVDVMENSVAHLGLHPRAEGKVLDRWQK